MYNNNKFYTFFNHYAHMSRYNEKNYNNIIIYLYVKEEEETLLLIIYM